MGFVLFFGIAQRQARKLGIWNRGSGRCNPSQARRSRVHITFIEQMEEEEEEEERPQWWSVVNSPNYEKHETRNGVQMSVIFRCRNKCECVDVCALGYHSYFGPSSSSVCERLRLWRVAVDASWHGTNDRPGTNGLVRRMVAPTGRCLRETRLPPGKIGRGNQLGRAVVTGRRRRETRLRLGSMANGTAVRTIVLGLAAVRVARIIRGAITLGSQHGLIVRM